MISETEDSATPAPAPPDTNQDSRTRVSYCAVLRIISQFTNGLVITGGGDIVGTV